MQSLGNAVAALNPYASLAWGGLQFFVDLAVNSGQVRRVCCENLPTVLELTVRYVTFTSVYENLEAEVTGSFAREVLLSLFVAILQYHICLVKFARSRSERLKAAFEPVQDSEPSLALKNLKDREAKLQSILTKARFETVGTWINSLASSIDTLRDISAKSAVQIDHIAQMIGDDHRNKILQWISPVLYESYHNNKANMDGTGEWLLEHADYMSWKYDPGNALFWLRGFMGSGKSCLTHAVIEDIMAVCDEDTGSILAYVYCDQTTQATQQDIASVDSLLRCIVKQLVQPAKGQALMSKVVELYERLVSKAELTVSDCVSLILQLANQSTATIIVIDGLDECPREPDDVQYALTTHLEQLMRLSSKPIHVFVSSRPEQQIYDFLQDLVSYEVTTESSNRHDIQHVIRAKVEASAAGRCKGLYRNKSAVVREKVIEVLDQNAMGMFRWVDLAIEWLHRSKSAVQMNDRIHGLTRLDSLDKMYEKIYQEIKSGCDDESDGGLIDTILRLVICAFPNFPDIYYEQDTDEEDQTERNFPIRGVIPSLLQLHMFHDLNEPSYTEDELLAMCAGLVSRNAAGLLIIPHASVIQYFQHYYPSTFSWKAGHAFLASLCIKRLQMYGTHPLSADCMLDSYCAFHWSSHLLEMSFHSSGNGFVDSTLDQEGFGSDITRFFNDKQAPALVAEAGKIISECLGITGRDYSSKSIVRKARLHSSVVNTSYRSHLLFCPDHQFGMLPIRIALDYKLDQINIPLPTQPLAPFEVRDLSLYGLASLLGNFRYLTFLVERGDQNQEINWEEILLPFLPNEYESYAPLLRRCRARCPAEDILTMIMRRGVTLGSVFRDDGMHDDPWTLFKILAACWTSLSAKAKAMVFQKLPRNCMNNPPFETFRSDLMYWVDYDFDLVRPLIESVRNDSAMMSELIAHLAAHPYSYGLQRLFAMGAVLESSAEIHETNFHMVVNMERDYKEAGNLTESLRLDLCMMRFMARKLDDDSKMAWPPRKVIEHLCRLLNDSPEYGVITKVLTLDESDPALREIRQIGEWHPKTDPDCTYITHEEFIWKIVEDLAEHYHVETAQIDWDEYSDVSYYDWSRCLVPTKISSVRNWKPYLEKLCTELELKLATELAKTTSV